MPTSENRFEVENLTVSYGPVTAINSLSLRVASGETVAIVGPNGAGKTSLLSAMAGLVRPAQGRVLLNGADLARLPSHRIARSGVVLVPEGRRMIAPLSVHESLLVAAQTGGHRRAARTERLAEVYEMLPVLANRRKQASGQLSGGEQQLLALARALLMDPLVLLLDEPSMGLAPIMIERVYEVLTSLHQTRPGLSLVLVEQSAELALDVCRRVHVLSSGHIDSDVVLNKDMSRAEIMEMYTSHVL